MELFAWAGINDDDPIKLHTVSTAPVLGFLIFIGVFPVTGSSIVERSAIEIMSSGCITPLSQFLEVSNRLDFRLWAYFYFQDTNK